MVMYTFVVNNTTAYYKVFGLAVLSFMAALVLLTAGLGVGFIDGEIGIGVSIGVLFLTPIITFYIRRKKATEDVTVLLDDQKLDIRWPGRTKTILFSDIKSYRAHYDDNEVGADVESVRIRLNDGTKIRLYATSDVCDVNRLGKFRRDFDALAKKLNLKSRYWSW